MQQQPMQNSSSSRTRVNQPPYGTVAKSKAKATQKLVLSAQQCDADRSMPDLPGVIEMPLPRTATSHQLPPQQEQEQQPEQHPMSLPPPQPSAAVAAAAAAAVVEPPKNKIIDDDVLSKMRQDVSTISSTSCDDRQFKLEAHNLQSNFRRAFCPTKGREHVFCGSCGASHSDFAAIASAADVGGSGSRCECCSLVLKHIVDGTAFVHPNGVIRRIADSFPEGEPQAREHSARLFYSLLIHKPIADLAAIDAVAVVPYPTHEIYTNYIDPLNAHRETRFLPPASQQQGCCYYYSLFVGALPKEVTTQQLFATIFVFTGVRCAAVRLHGKAHHQHSGSDATSAWVQIPIAAASDQEAEQAVDNIIGIINKNVLFDSVGWLFGGNNPLLWRHTMELRKTNENARYQKLPHAPITCVRAESAPASMISSSPSSAAASAASSPSSASPTNQQKQQQQPMGTSHDPMCAECPRAVAAPALRSYMCDIAPYCFDTRVPAMWLHSNRPEAHRPKQSAVDASNWSFRENWLQALIDGIGPRWCDRHRPAAGTDAAALYESYQKFEVAWDLLQKELRGARRQVPKRP